jgi:ABC-2 type transport system ATP-binding protein
MGLYGDMTGRELLDLFARLSGGPVDAAKRSKLLERMELSTTDVRRKLREYSTGMKRKLGIVQAFQSEPPLLILDEPTEGLDPLMQGALYELLHEAKREGRTVFMSSHVLSEVERLCDRIGLIARGELVLLAHVDEVKRLVARRVRVVFTDSVDRPNELPEGHEIVELQPRIWRLEIRGDLGPLLKRLAGLPVKDMEIEEPRLEEVLVRYYRGENQ